MRRSLFVARLASTAALGGCAVSSGIVPALRSTAKSTVAQSVRKTASGHVLTARWAHFERWNSWLILVRGFTPEEIAQGQSLAELARFESLFPSLSLTPPSSKRRSRSREAEGSARSARFVRVCGSDYYDYGDYAACGSGGGSSDGGSGSGSGSGSGAGGDTVGVGSGDVGTGGKPYCPPACPPTTFYNAQHGTFTMGQGGPLPDGSTWVSTDVDYSFGVTHGYIYHGSNGTQWYTGANDASRPESMDQYQLNMDAWYRNYQQTANCI